MARGKRSAFKLLFTVGSLCLAMWQLPGILDRVSSATAGTARNPAGAGAMPAIGDLLGGSKESGSAVDLAALLGQTPSDDDSGAQDAKPDPDDMVLYGATADMSEAERERLLREALARMPEPRKKQKR